MANVLRYDPPSGAALEYRTSVNTPDFEGLPNYLINPVLPVSFNSLPIYYFRVVSGVVEELSGAEKQALENAIVAGQLAAVKLESKANVNERTDPVARILKAFVAVMLDEINILRTHASIGLAARTATQVRNAIENKVDAQS